MGFLDRLKGVFGGSGSVGDEVLEIQALLILSIGDEGLSDAHRNRVQAYAESRGVPSSEFTEIADHFMEDLNQQDSMATLDALANLNCDSNGKISFYKACADIAAMDGELDEYERTLLGKIAMSLELSPQDAVGLIQQAFQPASD